jgi:hypothetical protein
MNTKEINNHSLIDIIVDNWLPGFVSIVIVFIVWVLFTAATSQSADVCHKDAIDKIEKMTGLSRDVYIGMLQNRHPCDVSKAVDVYLRK